MYNEIIYHGTKIMMMSLYEHKNGKGSSVASW